MGPGIPQPPQVTPKKSMDPTVLAVVLMIGLLVGVPAVIAVIGIVAAIAIPNFIKYQNRAKQAEAKVQLRALSTAELAYFQEHDRFLAVPTCPPNVPRREPTEPTASEQLEQLGVTLPPKIRYQYEVKTRGDRAELLARGDLDGDGKIATLRIELVDGHAGELEDLTPGEW